MANIKPYLDNIANAEYGEDVRGSLINALIKVNDDNDSYNDLKEEVIAARDDINDQVDQFDKKMEAASEISKKLEEDTASGNQTHSDLTNSVTTARSERSKLESAYENVGKVVESANKKKDALDASISSANNAKSNLTQVTDSADSAKTDLSELIDSATATKSIMDASVKSATTANTNLSESIKNAITAKNTMQGVTDSASEIKGQLDASNTTANKSKSALDETVRQANALDTSLGSKNVEGTQLNKDITASGNKAVSDINSASAKALEDINTTGTAKLDAVNKAAESIVADREQIAKNKTDIASLNEEMANVKSVTDTIDERILEAFFGSMRNGKVYQTEVYLTETNPTSDGVKTLANANMVCEPSTDTVEGRDDYEGIGIFNWFNCNYVTDDYGRKIPTAIEGWGNGYKNDGSVDVGVIAMTPYWSVIEKNGKQIWTLSDTPNDNYGLIPWETAKKEDGTYASYVIHSKYISGLGIDGLLRSFFNSKPFRNNCYNNMIDNYQKKGKACWGAGKERDMYVILHVVIKYATKNEQKIFKGTTSYSLQFSASIQRETKETYFPLTNSQASQIVVGSYVSVGYGSKNTDNTVNNDRGVGTIHQYADDVKVLRIEDIDENNKAVYLDIEEGFTTTPVALSDTLNAQIMLSTMHWWSGTTDKVIGKHDGSMGSNTDGKHPFRVMGIECSVGGYIVYSDSVMVFKEDYSKDVYIAPRGVKHVKDEATIKSTYKLIGNMPGNGGTDWWIGDIGVDMETCSWFAKAVGKSDSQGWGDRCYAGGKSTSGTREDLGRGLLWSGSHGGSVFVGCWGGLGGTSWYFLGCD